MNRPFSKNDAQMASKHTMFSLHSRQRNANLNYMKIPSHPVRGAVSQKMTKSKYWWGGGQKGELSHHWGEYVN